MYVERIYELALVCFMTYFTLTAVIYNFTDVIHLPFLLMSPAFLTIAYLCIRR